MEDMRQIIAKNISTLRTAKKMTQLELAETINYSDKAVSKWERGESLPDVITLKSIADLFGVTVDYIITEHAEDEKPPISRTEHNNHIFITLIAVFGVWLIGTFIFAFSGIFEQRLWFAFVICVPISMLVLLIFNSIWGKKIYNMFVISALMWTSLTTVYLGFRLYATFDLWTLFIIGIPAQVIIFLGFRIKNVNEDHRSSYLKTNRSKKKKTSDSVSTQSPSPDSGESSGNN